MIGDSECTLASLEKVNCAFGEYFENWIGEVAAAGTAWVYLTNRNAGWDLIRS